MFKINLKEFYFLLILIVIDQAIKIIIHKYFFIKDKIKIVDGILYFKPVINTKLSYISSKFNIETNRITALIITILIIYLIIMLRFYFNNKIANKSAIAGVDILISSSVCAFIDRLFWGGSLDYIYLKNMFIMDLKDIYAFIAAILMLIFIQTNKDEVKRFRLTKFIKFCFWK